MSLNMCYLCLRSIHPRQRREGRPRGVRTRANPSGRGAAGLVRAEGEFFGGGMPLAGDDTLPTPRTPTRERVRGRSGARRPRPTHRVGTTEIEIRGGHTGPPLQFGGWRWVGPRPGGRRPSKERRAPGRKGSPPSLRSGMRLIYAHLTPKRPPSRLGWASSAGDQSDWRRF
jgi:hypothetical protein